VQPFRVRFVLDEVPEDILAEYIIEAPSEADALSECNDRWRADFPEESLMPHTRTCVAG
jgi:hypothetical protein